MKSGSNLERIIASGKPAVTAELGPPMSADPHEVVEKAHKLKGFYGHRWGRVRHGV